MPNSIDKAMPSTDANIDVIPLALQKNGRSSEWRRQILSPSGNIIPMRNAGGASSSTDNNMRMSVASDRAHVVNMGVSSPASTSVVSRATTLAMTALDRDMRTDRGAADPAKEKNCEKHYTQPVDGMPKEDHQPLHLRYLNQHEAHADRTEIRYGWRQRRQRHPPRKTDKRNDDVVAAGAKRYHDEQQSHVDRRVVIRESR